MPLRKLTLKIPFPFSIKGAIFITVSLYGKVLTVLFDGYLFEGQLVSNLKCILV